MALRQSPVQSAAAPRAVQTANDTASSQDIGGGGCETKDVGRFRSPWQVPMVMPMMRMVIGDDSDGEDTRTHKHAGNRTQ